MKSASTRSQCLRVTAWLHRIEKLVPKIRVKAEQQGAIVIGNLGRKCLADRRVV